MRSWAKKLPTSFFIDDLADSLTMQKYKDIIVWAYNNPHYTDSAKKEFASAENADAFLIASAAAHEYIIVTHETHNAERKSSIPIPNAANIFDVKTLQVYDLLSLHACGTFRLKLRD